MTHQASKRERSVFIQNWIVDAGIGIHPHEYNTKQKIRLNITFFQDDIIAFSSKKIGDVVDYEAHKNSLQTLIDARHEALVETLADRLAQQCLKDPLVNRVIVKLEKLAVLPGTESCGVVIERIAGDY